MFESGATSPMKCDGIIGFEHVADVIGLYHARLVRAEFVPSEVAYFGYITHAPAIVDIVRRLPDRACALVQRTGWAILKMG